jgi:hypothetical protein
VASVTYLNVLLGWPRILAKVVSESSFSTSWWAGRRHKQKQAQETHFKYFGGLATEIGKSGLEAIGLQAQIYEQVNI